MCLDFDGKDNPEHTPLSIKQLLAGISEICYATESVSGTGVYAILQTNNDSVSDHPQVVEFLEKIFDRVGLKVDKSCKDVSRLRFISHDPEPFINPSYEIFDAQGFLNRYKESKKFKPVIGLQTMIPKNTDSGKEWSYRDKVEYLLKKIEATRTDITKNYNNWVLIGMSLAHEFGHDGYNFFCRISQFNEGFDYGKCNEKYLELLKNGKRIKIGTFFEICKMNNITFK